ncbi:MAG TPA: peptidase S41 [Flavobacteriaceae bacterium]|jgi:carboxyl-terminal processing protease|nr:peptidase S41 [Flavobacteriaceae bacterium]
MKTIKQLSIYAMLITVLTVSVGYKSDFFEVAKQIEIYTTLFKELNMYYIDETNPAKLTETAIDNMLEQLDPYTRYYDEQGVENARINAASGHGGIGASTKIIDDKLIVVEPYEGLSADKAGIKPGDEIVKINDLKVDKTSLKSIISMLNGSPDSKITLTLKRQDKTITIELLRTSVELNSVPYYKMLDEEVGYISFIKFTAQGSAKVKEAFEDLKAQGMKKLVLDVRGNPGGLLNEAVEITNFFIPKEEIVVTTKAKVKKWSDTYKTKREPIDLDIPIVVLINQYSASASEIVAGSLQDLDRAVIVGERSFGKGLVQRYRKLTYGTQLKLTIAKYYTPSGRCIQELDYTHTNDNGEVPKFSDHKRNVFTTKNGRKVYGGGGIEPDIKLTKSERTITTDALLKSDAIFNYATIFYRQNKTISSPEEFKLSDVDYQKFITYLSTNKRAFKTATDFELDNLLKTTQKEGLDSKINTEFQNLATKINTEKIKELAQNESEIKEALTNEIVRRYYYKKGEYIHKVNQDKSIIEALTILKDETKYQNILK